MKILRLQIAFTASFLLIGCVAHRAAPVYTNAYGTFHSPVDAACAHLYAGATDSQMKGASWQKKLADCRTNAANAAANQMAQGQAHGNQTLMAVGQALYQQETQQAPPSQHFPSSTHCYMVGTTMMCDHR